MKVQNLTSNLSNREVVNQFTIQDDNGNRFFQSYSTIIVKIDNNDKIYLDHKWNCSKTTSKYRNQFLGETTKETEAKIKSGEYILTDLN